MITSLLQIWDCITLFAVIRASVVYSMTTRSAAGLLPAVTHSRMAAYLCPTSWIPEHVPLRWLPGRQPLGARQCGGSTNAVLYLLP